jgi:hypothetical protein
MKIRDAKFLTNDELRYVLRSVSNATDEFSKEILKVALVAQIVILDVNWDEYETCNDMYDAVMAEGISFENEIRNYYLIDKIIYNENSVEKIVANFLNDLSNKIDEYAKTVDLSQMEGLVDELKKLSGADEVKTEAEKVEEIKIEK